MKTIFITGASTGLGKATAKLFASKNWNVIATMRKPENEKELHSIPNVTVLPLDVTDVDQIQETVQKAIAENDIDVVFNNAGYGLMGPLEGTSDEQMIRQIETNLLGVIRVTKAFIPYFREKGTGLLFQQLPSVDTLPFPSARCITPLNGHWKDGVRAWPLN